MTLFAASALGLAAGVAMTLIGCTTGAPVTVSPSPASEANPTPTSLIVTTPTTTAQATTRTPTTVPTTPSPVATETTVASATPSSEPVSRGLPPVGAWQVELTGPELVAAGWPANVTPPGTYTWTFAKSRATIDLQARDGTKAHCNADMASLDDGFRLSYEPGACGEEVDVIRWQAVDGGLRLSLVSTNAPVNQQKAYLETEIWLPAQPPI